MIGQQNRPEARAMKALTRLCWAAAVWAAVGLLPSPAALAEEPEAATRQYAAAVAFQNRGVYDLATEEWVKFIKTYPTDARMARAFHSLGVCYFQLGQADAKQLESAQQCFETVLSTYPKFDALEATYLYLGVTQFKRAQAGKPEMFDAAAASLDTLAAQLSQEQVSGPGPLHPRRLRLSSQPQGSGGQGSIARAATEGPDEKLLGDILYALGVTQEELKQPAEAGKAYDEFLKKFPESPLAAEVIMRPRRHAGGGGPAAGGGRLVRGGGGPQRLRPGRSGHAAARRRRRAS